jgi:hypothetical protein
MNDAVTIEFLNLYASPYSGRSGLLRWFRKEETDDPEQPFWCSCFLRGLLAKQFKSSKKALKSAKRWGGQGEIEKTQRRCWRWKGLLERWKLIRHWWNQFNLKLMKCYPGEYDANVIFAANSRHNKSFEELKSFSNEGRILFLCRNMEFAKELYTSFQDVSEDSLVVAIAQGPRAVASTRHSGGVGMREMWSAFTNACGPAILSLSNRERAYMNVVLSFQYMGSFWVVQRQSETGFNWANVFDGMKILKPIRELDFTIPRALPPHPPLQVVDSNND